MRDIRGARGSGIYSEAAAPLGLPDCIRAVFVNSHGRLLRGSCDAISVFRQPEGEDDGLAHQPDDSSGDARSCIPTTDPQAALRFCRTLAQTLEITGRILPPQESSPASETLGVRGEEVPAGPAISIVIPVYNEQETLPALHSRLSSVLKDIGLPYEIIFADDGSGDQSLVLLERLAMEDPSVVVIQLARNFGHQVAISAGLEYSSGRLVCVMDADLQDPPEIIPQLIRKIREGYDVVYAIREHRKESWPKRYSYAAFYRLLQWIANVSIPVDSGDFCMMKRRIVNLLVSMPERNRFLRGIRSWVGFRQMGVPYARQSRFGGKSKYSVRSLIRLALDGAISFSNMPLRIISIIGITVSLLSVAVAAFYVIKKLAYGIGVPGFTTLVVAIFFLAGIQLVTIGVIGEYVGRIFDQVKQRPLYIVRQVTKRGSPSAS